MPDVDEDIRVAITSLVAWSIEHGGGRATNTGKVHEKRADLERLIADRLPPPDTVPVARADLRRVLDAVQPEVCRRHAGLLPNPEDRQRWREIVAAWERLDAATRDDS